MLTDVIATTLGIANFATLATLPVDSSDTVVETALSCVSPESDVVSSTSCVVSIWSSCTVSSTPKNIDDAIFTP